MRAIIIGATGLVGSELLKQLLDNDSYSSVLAFVRRSTQLEHPKLKQYIVDFDKPDAWKEEVKGDVLFSCLGTTIKQAGSQARQYKVDFTYQYEFAKIARDNGVKQYVLVSSMGANSQSKFFYPRMKGELDNAIGKLDFETTIIIRPSLLYGGRKEKRVGEIVGYWIFKGLNKIGILKGYRPIHGSIVAKAMINSLSYDSRTYAKNQLFELAG